MEDNYNEEFKKGEVVWAKIVGYPWWPAKVTEIKMDSSNTYRVDFFWDHSHAFLPAIKLAKYARLREQQDTYHHMTKGLRKAVNEADRLWARQSQSGPSFQTQTPLQRVTDGAPQQLLQAPLLQSTPQQPQLNHQETPLDKQAHSPHPKPCKENELTLHEEHPPHEASQSQQHLPSHMIYSKQQRKQFVNTLLRKYGLTTIPKVEEEQEPKRKQQVERRRRCANKETKKEVRTREGPSMMFLLVRKIFKVLGGKGLSVRDRRSVSLSLGKQVMEGGEEGKSLFQWISITPTPTILNFYHNWASLQCEKDKPSCTTIEE